MPISVILHTTNSSPIPSTWNSLGVCSSVGRDVLSSYMNKATPTTMKITIKYLRRG